MTVDQTQPVKTQAAQARGLLDVRLHLVPSSLHASFKINVEMRSNTVELSAMDCC